MTLTKEEGGETGIEAGALVLADHLSRRGFSLDDLRRVADRIEYSISEFQAMVDDMRDNGMLMRKADGGYKVLS